MLKRFNETPIENYMQSPTTGDLVSVADFAWDGVAGTNIVQSALIELPIPAVDFIMPQIKITFTHQRTAGTGTVSTWARIFGTQLDNLADAGNGNIYTGMTSVAGTARSRIVRIMPKTLHVGIAGLGTDAETDRLLIYVRARGSLAGTEWSVTSVGARFIYVPV